jgi:hypothetical protein
MKYEAHILRVPNFFISNLFHVEILGTGESLFRHNGNDQLRGANGSPADQINAHLL